MADDASMALEELLSKAQLSDDVDFLREGIRVLAQALMEAEVTQHLGAGRYERTPGRTGERNGTRERRWDTQVGSLTLRVPRVRDGSYFPSLLEPRRRAERALVAVVQEAYVQGVSTRRVDDLAQALGLSGISKSQVSVICQELHAEVECFRTRPLSEAVYPYVWLDATSVKARVDGRVAGQAVVIAIGLNATTGQREVLEVLGLDVGPSEDGAFWLGFLRGLVARGLTGVQLVVSDAHEGLKAAISSVLHGASWQRCRVHCVRNALALVPQSAQQLVAATIRTVFVQPDPEVARQTWRQVAESFRLRYPKLAALLDAAETDVLAYLAFPPEHWRQIGSNNPLERLNREVKRRSDVVGIFPNAAAIVRLVGMILAEQHDEWQVGRRYFSAESLAKLAPPSVWEAASALTLATSSSPASTPEDGDGNHQNPHLPGGVQLLSPRPSQVALVAQLHSFGTSILLTCEPWSASAILVQASDSCGCGGRAEAYDTYDTENYTRQGAAGARRSASR